MTARPTWWQNASRADRIAQIKGAASGEYALTLPETAIMLGTTDRNLRSFAKWHGVSFPSGLHDRIPTAKKAAKPVEQSKAKPVKIKPAKRREYFQPAVERQFGIETDRADAFQIFDHDAPRGLELRFE